MNQEVALKNLLDIAEVLADKHWWLEAGTALGAYRNRDFITYDQDVDFGIYEEDWNKNIVSQIVKKGFTIWKEFGTRRNGYEISFKRDGVKVDIFLFYKEGEKRVHSAWLDDNQIKFWYPEYYLDTLGHLDFLGHELPVPWTIEEYLTHKYGDWRIPDPKWHWAHSPKNKLYA